MKLCSKCKVNKAPNHFTVNNRAPDKLSYQCKDCSASYRDSSNKRLTNNSDLGQRSIISRARQLTKYWPDLSPAEALEKYGEMLIDQNKACSFCDTYIGDLNRALCVDHSHDTGEVRGLVCNSCNVHLISIHTIETAERLVKYLKRFK